MVSKVLLVDKDKRQLVRGQQKKTQGLVSRMGTTRNVARANFGDLLEKATRAGVGP